MSKVSRRKLSNSVAMSAVHFSCDFFAVAKLKSESSIRFKFPPIPQVKANTYSFPRKTFSKLGFF